MTRFGKAFFSAALLILGLSPFARAEIPTWDYTLDSDGKVAGVPVKDWLRVDISDGGKTSQLWFYRPHLKNAIEGKPGFAPPTPAYDKSIPLFDLFQEGAPEIRRGKKYSRFQGTITPYRISLKIKTEGGKRKAEKMTVTRDDNPAFAQDVPLTTAFPNIGFLMGGDGLSETIGGKAAVAAVRPPTIGTWKQVKFKDAGTDVTAWFLQTSLKRAAAGNAEFKSPNPAYDYALPLFSVAPAGTPETGETTVYARFTSASTPYQLFLKMKPQNKGVAKMTVMKNGAAVQDISTDTEFMNLGLLLGGDGKADKIGGKTAMADVRGGAPPVGLSDYEKAMADLMPAEARAKAVADCKGDASAAATPGPLTDCWRGKVKDTLTAYKDKATKPGGVSPTEFDPFETSYIQKRLGADYPKFQTQYAAAQQAGKGMDFVKAWRARVLSEVNGYLASAPGSGFKPQDQLESVERLLTACDSSTTADTLKYCGNAAWGGSAPNSSVVDTRGAGGQAGASVPPGDKRPTLTIKAPPSIGADKGASEPPAPDKNANVDLITGMKLGVFAMLVAFLFGGPFGLILLAGMIGTALGWVMSKDINR